MPEPKFTACMTRWGSMGVLPTGVWVASRATMVQPQGSGTSMDTISWRMAALRGR